MSYLPIGTRTSNTQEFVLFTSIRSKSQTSRMSKSPQLLLVVLLLPIRQTQSRQYLLKTHHYTNSLVCFSNLFTLHTRRSVLANAILRSESLFSPPLLFLNDSLSVNFAFAAWIDISVHEVEQRPW